MTGPNRIRAFALITSIIAVMSFTVHTTLLSAKSKHDAEANKAPETNASPAATAPAPFTSTAATMASAQGAGSSGTSGPVGDPFRPVLPDPNASLAGIPTAMPANLQMRPGGPNAQLQTSPLQAEPPRPPLKLEGVVLDGKRMAVLTAGDSHFYAMPGDTVGEGYKVAWVDRSGVVLKKGSHKYTVEIGDSLEPFLVGLSSSR